MRILTKAGLSESRHVRTDAYEADRFVLASDGAGATVTDIVLRPGVETDGETGFAADMASMG